MKTGQVIFSGKTRWQMAGALAGGVLGLVLLVISLQLWIDVHALSSGESSGEERFVMVNKQVNVFNTLGVKSGFSDEELEALKAQPFVKEIAPLTSNRFKVTAYSPQLGFSTELFFESLPRRYIDPEVRSDFSWSEGERRIPVVLSADYLALYNFGFAPAQGLPQFTAGTIKRVGFELVIRGNGQREVFEGRIAGFSDRINSILVPQEFMDWANSKFDTSEDQLRPSRLMVEAENPWADNFQNFLSTNGMEVSRGKLIGGQMAATLSAGIGVVGGLGLALVVLATLTFLLIFELLVSRAAGRIRLLLELGYRPAQVASVIVRRLILLVAAMAFISIAVILGLRKWQVTWMSAQGLEEPHILSLASIAAGLLVVALILLMNLIRIRRLVGKLFEPKV